MEVEQIHVLTEEDELLQAFIEEYEASQVLWNSALSDHSNKTKRNAALEKL